MSKNTNKFVKASGGIIGFLLVLCIAITINVIVRSQNLYVDMTEEKLFTLSDGTKQMLGKLDKQVTMKFFFSRSLAEVPAPLKEYGRRIEAILKEYEIAGNGNIVVEKIDPKPDSDQEDWARRYGIEGPPLGPNGPFIYLGLLVEVGEAHAAIPFIHPRFEGELEYQISRIILRVANPARSIVGVVSSLPVMGSAPPAYAMPRQPGKKPPWAAFDYLGQDFAVRRIPMTSVQIDPDLDLLIVVHPQGFSDETLYGIDQFVMRGGRLMVFVDPLSYADMEVNAEANPYGKADVSSDLDPLFKAWGVEYESGMLVADAGATTRLPDQRGQVTDNAAWLSLSREHMNEAEVTTSSLENMMMPFAGSFKISPESGLKVTPLIQSTLKSTKIDSVMARMGSDAIDQDLMKTEGTERLSIAVRLDGKFKTAFPDGAPENHDSEEAQDDAGRPKHLSESQAESAVLLVGDVDLLYNPFCVQEINMVVMKQYQRMNDNMDFFANAVDQMSGSSDLVNIRSRGRTQRPFEVVDELEGKAQEKFRVERDRLRREVDETDRRLQQLQSQKDDTQKYIMSPAQKIEIDQLRKKQSATNKQLREVEKKLRRDIEWLGLKVKAINTIAIPFIVCLAGAVFWFYRRSRSVKKG